MRTRSGNTYFVESESQCPICQEASVSVRPDGRRMYCVDSCACKEPSTHAHCFVMLCKRNDLFEEAPSPRKCPACMTEVSDFDLVLRQAQFNHSLLRKDDPAYSLEPDVSTHCAAYAIRSMIVAAKAFDAETRNMAVRFSHHQNYILTLSETASRLISDGKMDRAIDILAKMRGDLVESINDNRTRFTYQETLEYFMHLEELRSMIFFYTGIEDEGDHDP